MSVSPSDPKKASKKPRFAGMPSFDMRPGEYVVRCESGRWNIRGKQSQAVLQFVVLGKQNGDAFENAHAGVVLTQWYSLPDDLVIKPYSKYGQAWMLAQGRAMTSDDDPSPSVFEGKVFLADVGFKSSSADGTFSFKHTLKPKDDGRRPDFLRIHLLREKIEENRQTHMSHMVHKHKHVNEHEHDPKTLALASTSSPASETGLVFRMDRKSKSNEPRPQGHADSAAMASSPTAAAPALTQLFEQQRGGFTDLDVVSVFGPGAKLVEKNGKPVQCGHCGGEIEGIVEANGKPAWWCRACGRRAKKHAL
jgi:hypothetical protein